MAVFIHYNIATAAGTQGCNCQGQAPPAIDIWDPSALDTDAWIREGVAMGATRFIYVAKHGCGFLAWNSSTDYPYSAAKSKSPNADVVGRFVESAKKAGVGYGFYYSVVSNGLLNVCNGIVQPNPVPGQLAVTQQQYDDLVIAHLTELWGNYGPLTEIWFDGGYTPSLKPRLQKLMSELQPHVIVFNGEDLSASPARWVGTEGGHAPYPCWSTDVHPTQSGAGNADGTEFIPAETDFTLQNSDQWFYNPNAGVHPPAELRSMYETSVGHNSPVIIDFAPFPNGSLPQEQVIAARTLGTFVRGCYSTPAAEVTASGEAAMRLAMPLPAWGSTVDRVLISEDFLVSRAQIVRSFKLSAALTDGSIVSIMANGSSIGSKFIVVLPAPLNDVAFLTLEITGLAAGAPTGAPFIALFAAYSCNRLAERLDAEWELHGFHQPHPEWAPEANYKRLWSLKLQEETQTEVIV